MAIICATYKRTIQLTLHGITFFSQKEQVAQIESSLEISYIFCILR